MAKKQIKNTKTTNKERKTVTVAFAGGGTGGHIYPGLAIADELRDICNEADINLNLVWIGNSKGMDQKIVESNIGSDEKPSVFAVLLYFG